MQEHNIKNKIRERYGKIALTGTETCCAPTIRIDNKKAKFSGLDLHYYSKYLLKKTLHYFSRLKSENGLTFIDSI